jgi:arylsulfate sulfotransferase
MDNGNDRLYPASAHCPRNPEGVIPTACEYTTIPVFRIDEKAGTATLTFHQILPHSPASQPGMPITDFYSEFGGNTDQLPNGHVEYDLCGLTYSGLGAASLIREVTPDSRDPKPVWTLELQNINFYRAFRIPSLYPGVQW